MFYAAAVASASETAEAAAVQCSDSRGKHQKQAYDQQNGQKDHYSVLRFGRKYAAIRKLSRTGNDAMINAAEMKLDDGPDIERRFPHFKCAKRLRP